MLGAAAGAMVVALASAVVIGRMLPGAHTDKLDPQSIARSASGANGAAAASWQDTGDRSCASCGTAISIHAVLLGNSALRPDAIAGTTVERGVTYQYTYRVTVRMDDGVYRTLSQSNPPRFSVGERVRVANGAVLANS